MTPVEERIDHAKRRVRMFMEANRREGKSAVFSYHRLYFEDLDDLLTEHSALRDLLREAWEFPEYPGPGEGLVSTSEDFPLQTAWRERWLELDARIKAVLPATESAQPEEERRD